MPRQISDPKGIPSVNAYDLSLRKPLFRPYKFITVFSSLVLVDYHSLRLRHKIL